jgi:hypothetical protein
MTPPPPPHVCAAWQVVEDNPTCLQIVMSEPHGICLIVNGAGITDLDRQTADFIVRATASHHALVNALELLLLETDGTIFALDSLGCRMAVEALAKVKGDAK